MSSEVSPTFERILTAREKADLCGQLFLGSEIIGVDLSGADLRGARFERAILVSTTLAGADLRGAHFILCELRFVRLAGARLGNNRFDGTTLVEMDDLEPDEQQAILRHGGAFQHMRASLR
jgi:uncharacterized protein YjbI with pentapeptide repeats